jgi:myo-inositol-1(or 4)-monophosphatase
MTVDVPLFQALSRTARSAMAESTGRLAVQDKGDGVFDPVTQLDRVVESAIREFLESRFPDDGVSGEELGQVRPEAPRQWSIDPIDGTRSFVCGLPSWAILVGFVEEQKHIASMIDLPATSELFIAVDGKTICNGIAVQTSGQRELALASLSTTDPFLFSELEFEAFNRLRLLVRMTRYGLDGPAYARLAAGGLDLVVESNLKAHDYDALIPIVRGAGGHIGDWDGGDDFASGRILAAATRELYDRAVEILRGPA